MGAYLNMVLNYARAPIGQRVHMPKPFNRGMKLSVIGAISTARVEASLYGPWATDGDIFYHFIAHDLCPILQPHHIVLLDNVGFHKTQRVQDAIHATGASIDFLPPYSPDFNPIEMAWSFVKNILQEIEARTLASFQKALKYALEKITENKLLGWFQHAGYRSTQ